jgi:uncharacterized protein (DUF849 family)
MIQACLNGDRTPDEHPAVPAQPEELALDAARAVAAGAAALHVHTRDLNGIDTLDPGRVAATVEAIRETCPDTPLGLTTGLWTTAGDGARRLRLVESWSVLPDYVSANVREDGFAELCALLRDRGIAIEAGVWSVADAHLLAECGDELLRVLIEVADGVPSVEVARAREIAEAVQVDAPQLHHAEGLATWAVIDAAAALGHDTRVGLEDTLVLPDGSTASGNAELVAEAVRRLGSG